MGAGTTGRLAVFDVHAALDAEIARATEKPPAADGEEDGGGEGGGGEEEEEGEGGEGVAEGGAPVVAFTAHGRLRSVCVAMQL